MVYQGIVFALIFFFLALIISSPQMALRDFITFLYFMLCIDMYLCISLPHGGGFLAGVSRSLAVEVYVLFYDNNLL